MNKRYELRIANANNDAMDLVRSYAKYDQEAGWTITSTEKFEEFMSYAALADHIRFVVVYPGGGKSLVEFTRV